MSEKKESEEQKVEEQEEDAEGRREELQQQVVLGALKKHSDAPEQDMIEQWKIQHGEIFASGFSDDELFIFRPAFRQEWLVLQERAQKDETMTEPLFQEAVCDLCVLWRSNKATWERTKAGTVSALYEMILQHSNFVSPQAASMLVVRL